jgi:hypothetical protein
VFQAQLGGDSEVPTVTTSATGTLTLTVAADLTKVDYVLEVKNLQNLAVARLHEGKAGQVGDTIITLYPGPTKSGAFTGVVKRGTFTAADLTGPLAGKKISALVALLKSGSVYLNIGTTAHSGGEIRGQLRGPASTSTATAAVESTPSIAGAPNARG